MPIERGRDPMAKAEPPPDVVSKVRKLARIAADLRLGKEYSITRLTTLKSLCKEPKVAANFALHMAKLTRDQIEREPCPKHLQPEEWEEHKRLIAEAVPQMEDFLERPTPEKRDALSELHRKFTSAQNEFVRVYGGPVRQIKNKRLLLVEDALKAVLREDEAPFWAYKIARDYAERYDPRHGTGLIPSSAPMVEDIVSFWIGYYGIQL
jgi:hypothetical protein